jgi:hypothetical protein
MEQNPYLEPPTIPEGMTVWEYRINRPTPKVSTFRRMLCAARPGNRPELGS